MDNSERASMMRIEKVKWRAANLYSFIYSLLVGIRVYGMRFPSLIVVAHDSFPNEFRESVQQSSFISRGQGSKTKNPRPLITSLANFYERSLDQVSSRRDSKGPIHI